MNVNHFLSRVGPIIGLVLGLGGGLSHAPGVRAQVQTPGGLLQLVTEREMLESQAAMVGSQSGAAAPIARSVSPPDAPRIEVVLPDLRSPVSVPTRIRVRFASEAPAEPKPETFKVLYGALRLDITQRLLGVARVTREGIEVADATLPSGRHQLQLMLSDSLGREARQTVVFIVP